MPLRTQIKKIANRTPLWMQLALFTCIITFFLIMYLIHTDYRRNLDVIMNTQIESSAHMLSIEMNDLEEYIRELSYFCVQTCYDQAFTNIVEKDAPIIPDEETYIKNQMRGYFYSRNDLSDYSLYLFNHGKRFNRSKSGVIASPISATLIMDTEHFKACEASNFFHTIAPSNNDDVFFDYYHSLLRIKTKRPLAMVKLTVNQNYWKSLSENHEAIGEFLCITNDDGELLNAGHDMLKTDQKLFQEVYEKAMETSSFTYEIDGNPYLVSYVEGDTFHMKMFAFMPMSYVDQQISQARNTMLVSGFLAGIALILLMTLLIKTLTRPLSVLAKQMEIVGEGDFTSTVNINGSKEVVNLSHSFNDMIEHIDNLIKQNYVTQLNEKNARITALEAQINPHFLYNTLQAIATEALLNDQIQIYNMITSLASGLRYSIKGGDFVLLYQEMDYVQKYCMLQQMRMGDKLKISYENPPETSRLYIPKISVQVLVENSILHGIGPDNDSIEIKVSSQIKDNLLYISVWDNGCGISKEALKKLEDSFLYSLLGNASSIGLSNLYSRLHLLYKNEADMKIESELNEYTKITLIVPIKDDLTNL